MVDVSSILTQNLPPVSNPLDTLSKVQGLSLQQAQIANTQQQLQNLKTQNDTGQQALQVARMNRQAQVAYGLSNLSDDQLKGGQPVRDALDAELRSGTIDQNTHDVMISNLPSADAPASAWRQSINSHLIGTLAGPAAIQAVTGSPYQINNGGQVVGGVQEGPLSPNAGRLNTNGGGIPMGLGPTTIDRYDPNAGGPGVGGMVKVPIGGTYGVPPPAPGAVPSVPGMPSQGNPLMRPMPQGTGGAPPPPGSATPGSGGIPINGPPVNPSSVPTVADRPSIGNSAVPRFNDQTGAPYNPGDMIVPSGLPPKFDPQTGTSLNGFRQTGRLPPPPPIANVTPGAVPPPVRTAANPFMSAPPIGAAESATQNQQAFRNAQVETAALPLQNTQYKEAYDAIARLNQTGVLPTTGIGATAIAKARQVLSDLGASSFSPLVVDAASAEKYLSMAIANKAPSSDARQQLFEQSNPTLHMPAGASLPIIQQIIASNRAKQATLATAPDQQNGNGFLAHQTAKAQLLNTPEGLKALSWDMVPQAERDRYVAALKAKGGAAWANFGAALKIAHDNNLIGGS